MMPRTINSSSRVKAQRRRGAGRLLALPFGWGTGTLILLLPAQHVVFVHAHICFDAGAGALVGAEGPDHEGAVELKDAAGRFGETEKTLRAVFLGDGCGFVEGVAALVVVVHVERDDVRGSPRVAEDVVGRTDTGGGTVDLLAVKEHDIPWISNMLPVHTDIEVEQNNHHLGVGGLVSVPGKDIKGASTGIHRFHPEGEVRVASVSG